MFCLAVHAKKQQITHIFHSVGERSFILGGSHGGWEILTFELVSSGSRGSNGESGGGVS